MVIFGLEQEILACINTMGEILQIIRNSIVAQTMNRTEKTAAGNSTYKKLAVQLLHEALCFVSSSVVADSLVLRKRQLLVAANRWR